MIEKIKIKEIFDLASKYHQKNNFKKAENLYESILEVDPNHLESNFRLGSLSAQINNLKKATSYLVKAIEIEPLHSKAYNNLGIVFIRLREFKKAKICYEKAIEIEPNQEEAYSNLGLVLNELGENKKSIISYVKAIEINPNHLNAIKNISILFKQVQLDNLTGNNLLKLKKLFLLLFKRNDIEHNDIFFNAKTILLTNEKYKYFNKIVVSDLLLEKAIIKNILEEELFHLMLQKSLIQDRLLEKILTKIRQEILSALINFNQDILKSKFEFMISLAEQCFFNEYCFAQSKEEIGYINQLRDSIENEKEINEYEIAILGCYIPLNASEIIGKKLLNYKSKNNLFNDLISLQIKEPLKEKELLNSIKSFDSVSNSVSKKVRNQYEKNPYPRWRYSYRNSPSNPLVIINNQIKPNKIESNDKFNSPNILIAGCGTGKHIFIAQNYLNAKIFVVDLSKASLAYAKRKTDELGIDNVEFLQADILQLENLNRKFDLIESVGVLHHMQDPLKGLKILLNLLEPHGFLKLGLYSKIARNHIIEVKKLIKKNNFKSSIDDIRNFRQIVINDEKDKSLKKIYEKTDFYSTSAIRDLLFHVQECHYKLDELKKILLDFNLEFLGFADLNMKNEYAKLYSKDKKNIFLDNWNKFEIDNPDTFTGMYNFWIRKIIK